MSAYLYGQCPQCGTYMAKREGRNGSFYGCAAYPRCRHTQNTVGEQKPLKEYQQRAVDYAGTHSLPAMPTGLGKVNSTVTGSPEQQAIWNAIQHGAGHIIVKALAGTGKSFTCRHAMQLLPRECEILYLAFNKIIVDEFRGEAPPNATVQTLNGAGFRCVKRAHPDTTVDNDKVQNILSELCSYEETNQQLVTAVVQLVGLAQSYLCTGHDPKALLELAARHDVEMDADIQARALVHVPAILEISQARPNVCSYNDQLWLPVVLKLPAPKYDVIFVDEAQDLNRLQHALVMRHCHEHTRVIVVGDDHQAIYGFRGSDVNSIANFTKLLDSTGLPVETFPLTVTRRCSKAVTRAAQQYIPQFTALPDAAEGSVRSCSEDAADYQPGDMVLCRINAPLASIALRLIKHGVKAVIRGRDIGTGLTALVRRMKCVSVNNLFAALDSYRVRELSRVAGTRQEKLVTEQVNDRVDTIYALSEGCENVTEVCARISSIFDNFDADGAPRNAVILSSIHRAKGLEANRVWWYKPDHGCKAEQPWQQVQETNLRYVAITRAQSELVLVVE